jgi:hypothetical protein
VVLIFFSSVLVAQDWRSPIDHEIRLSGTFCELRTNHFHHGLDIKSSQGVSGDPVYAIGDGKIHRLRVQAAGYGNSIYIEHPEGYVSVYGHLLDIDPTLDSVVQAYQYALEQFEIDIYCDSLNLKVNKGDQIGRMGSSGYSFGPHLHFEIRNAQTETTINPLLFGFEMKDNISPSLSHIRLDYLTVDGRRFETEMFPVIRNKYSCSVFQDTIRVGAVRCGLALKTLDKMNQSYNRNGLYKIMIHADSQLVYQFSGDSVRFEDSRGVNLLKDVETYTKSKQLWYQTYDLPGSPLPNHLLYALNRGWIDLSSNKARKVDIELLDYSQNSTFLTFFIVQDESLRAESFHAFNYHLLHQEPNIITTQSMELHCPESAFYRDQFVRLEEITDASEGHLSEVVRLSGDFTPFHRSCKLRLKAHAGDSTSLRQAVILSCGGDDFYNLGGIQHGDWIECPISTYDEFVVHRDRRPPTFEIISFPKEVRNGSNIRMKIYDEYESKGSAREVQCRAEIDGRWILVRHDVKSNTFTCQLKNLSKGNHEFVIKYWDHVGNQASWSRKITIK